MFVIVCVTTEADRKVNRLYVATVSVACLDELFGELKLSSGGGDLLSKACGRVAPALTALLAVLDLITLEFRRANPLRRTPLQRDGCVTDVFHRQRNGLAGRGWR